MCPLPLETPSWNSLPPHPTPLDCHGGPGLSSLPLTENSYWLCPHIDIWQKPTQYCKAIILQVKFFFLKKDDRKFTILNFMLCIFYLNLFLKKILGWVKFKSQCKASFAFRPVKPRRSLSICRWWAVCVCEFCPLPAGLHFGAFSENWNIYLFPKPIPLSRRKKKNQLWWCILGGFYPHKSPQES